MTVSAASATNIKVVITLVSTLLLSGATEVNSGLVGGGQVMTLFSSTLIFQANTTLKGGAGDDTNFVSLRVLTT